MHQNSFVCGVANSLWTKGVLFYRCLDKIVYAQFSARSGINNSSGQRSCPKLQPYMLTTVHANESPPDVTGAYSLPSTPSSQAERAEAVSISAELEDGPGSDSGRRPEHRHGLRREAEGGAALLCVWEAVLHQRAGARRSHELLTAAAPSDRHRLPSVLFLCYMAACTCEDAERVFDAGLHNSGLAFVSSLFYFFSQARYCDFCYESLD